MSLTLPRRLTVLALLCLIGGAGCPSEEPDTGDQDGDGFLDEDDCGPLAPQVHPGADDPYGDGIDTDCDGADGVDVDRDGYPANVADNLAYRELQDCDDNAPTVHPGAVEELGDGVDQDCDGVDGTDADQDGWGSVATGGLDCDDDDPSTHPGLPDPAGDGVDRNCDGVDGEDGDRDGVPSADSGGTDCDDDDPGVYPGAFDGCDGLDTNCLTDPSEVDDDGDGWLICAGDCDDGDATRHPGAVEACDGLDQDCDGIGDTEDTDGDGLRNCDGDCDDTDAQVFPGAPERCNGADDDCDGQLAADERDDDGDGHVECLGDCNDANANAFPGAWGDVTGDGVDLDCGGSDGPDGLGGASVTFPGTVAGDAWGRTVLTADIDGDGLDDVLVAAPGAGLIGGGISAEGRVYLFLGSQLGSPGLPDTFDPADAFAVLRGESGFDGAGTGIANVGDLGGDGRDDLLIGAPGHDGPAGQNAGRVYLIGGADLLGGGLIDMAAAASRIWDGEAGDELGAAIAGGHDLTGDGTPDMAVGGIGWDNWIGAVWVVSGAQLGQSGARPIGQTATWRLTGVGAGSFAGKAVAMGPDVTGDGRADLLITATHADGTAPGSGRIYLVSGATLSGTGTAWLGSASHIFEGVQAELAGDVVAFAGDVDGDFRSDLLMGSASTGRVHLWLSSTLPAPGVRALASSPIRFQGAMVRGAAGADVDGDGLSDVAIAAPGTNGAGMVWLYLGADLPPVGTLGAAQASFTWAGTAANQQAGYSIGSGDVNGDGYDDLIVGSGAPPDGTNAGQAWVLRSPY